MNRLFSKILKAGFLVGTLDILSAFLYYFIKTKNNPLTILQFVASGVFGKAAFAGGNEMLLYGLVLHYIIAFAFTLFFFWIFPKLKLLSKNRIGTGIVYGIFVWMVMNLMIVPFSRIPARPFDSVNALINAVILVVCIGIPLSFMANSAYRKSSRMRF